MALIEAFAACPASCGLSSAVTHSCMPGHVDGTFQPATWGGLAGRLQWQGVTLPQAPTATASALAHVMFIKLGLHPINAQHCGGAEALQLTCIQLVQLDGWVTFTEDVHLNLVSEAALDPFACCGLCLFTG